jgi:hypothetical protein
LEIDPALIGHHAEDDQNGSRNDDRAVPAPQLAGLLFSYFLVDRLRRLQ